MNPRDFLTTAAIGLVLVVGGLALLDSLRGGDPSGTEAAPATASTEPDGRTTTSEDGPQAQAEAPAGWPGGELSGVLTFLDAGSCGIRAVGLAGGRERPIPDYPLGCQQFWTPDVGGRFAYQQGEPTSSGRFVFALRDVAYGNRDFGTYEAVTRVVWSPDAQRVAWCSSRQTGAEREFYGDARPLSFCPIAYTARGNLAHAEGRRLLLGSTVLLHASGRIREATFGTDGSVVVVTRQGRIERHAPGHPPVILTLPPRWTGQAPVTSPSTCSVAVPLDDDIQVIDLCFGQPTIVIGGQAAAWSPDGVWLAVADADTIVFRRMDGSNETAVWPARALLLAWRLS